MVEQPRPNPSSPPPPHREQREHVRYLCADGAMPRLVAQAMPNGHRVVLRDLSAGGVGLLMDRLLEVGRRIAVDLWDDPGGSCTRVGRVTRVLPHPPPEGQPAGEWWLIGCRFELTLSDHDLHRALGAPAPP